MSDQQDNQEHDERQSRLMDSLLERAVKATAEDDERRVNTLISAIRGEAASVTSDARPGRSRRLLRWLPIPLAAGILVAVVFLSLPGGSQNAAMAALDRTIRAQQQPNAREYAVTIVARRQSGRTRSTNHRLFVRQREFAIRSPALLGSAEVWAGGNDERRWLVPTFGPVLVGPKGLLKTELPNRRVLETPFMSMETILERTKRFYDLSLKSKVTLRQGSVTIECDHIVGERIRSPRFVIPERVEIWADPETGFARQLCLLWADDDESRWKSATAELVATPTLTDDFFEHTAHHDPDRRVIQKN